MKYQRKTFEGAFCLVSLQKEDWINDFLFPVKRKVPTYFKNRDLECDLDLAFTILICFFSGQSLKKTISIKNCSMMKIAKMASMIKPTPRYPDIMKLKPLT